LRRFMTALRRLCLVSVLGKVPVTDYVQTALWEISSRIVPEGVLRIEKYLDWSRTHVGTFCFEKNVPVGIMGAWDTSRYTIAMSKTVLQ
jgi:hypothetical protein